MNAEATVHVTVVYSPAPRQVHEWSLSLPPGSTVLEALRASGMAGTFPLIDLAAADVGVWGRKARNGQLLRERDRVEVYRPLQVDPKLARRERFRKQGVRAPGLFAGKKAGAKAGY